jgi:hypothetical protein
MRFLDQSNEQLIGDHHRGQAEQAHHGRHHQSQPDTGTHRRAQDRVAHQPERTRGDQCRPLIRIDSDTPGITHRQLRGEGRDHAQNCQHQATDRDRGTAHHRIQAQHVRHR